jgi:NitT/TauT family transport system substrate-binding protein
MFARSFASLALLIWAVSAQAETNRLRIASQFGLVYLPVVVAHEEKLFGKRASALGLPDLEVTFTRISGSTAITEAVLSGSVDLGVFGTPGLLVAWEKTKGPQHVSGVVALGSHTHYLYTNRPHVKSLTDFKDEDRISVPAYTSPQAILLRTAFARAAPSAPSIESRIVTMPHPESTAAVLSGAVAGYMSSPPFSQILSRDPRVHAIFNSNELVKGASAVVLGGADSFIQANPKLIEAVIGAIDDAVALIRSDPARAAGIYMASERVKLSEQDVLGILTDGSITYDPVPHGIGAYARFMADLKMLRAVPSSWQEVFVPAMRARHGD